MRYAVRKRMIPANPMSLMERSERPRQGRKRLRVLSTDEIDWLLAAADPEWRVLLEVALFAGLRASELGGLTWKDVYLDAGVIRAPSSKQLVASRSGSAACRPRSPRSAHPRTHAAGGYPS